MNAFLHARGRTGRVQWGGAIAAELDAWSVTFHEEALRTVRGTLHADVRSVNHFRITQSPLTIVLDMGAGDTWRWRVSAAQVEGAHLSAVLEGAPGV